MQCLSSVQLADEMKRFDNFFYPFNQMDQMDIEAWDCSQTSHKRPELFMWRNPGLDRRAITRNELSLGSSTHASVGISSKNE